MGESSVAEQRWACSVGVRHNSHTTLYGYDPDSDSFVPDDENRLRLCRDMDEKAAVLKEKFEAKTFASVEECQGNAFINLQNWREARKVSTIQESIMEEQ